MIIHIIEQSFTSSAKWLWKVYQNTNCTSLHSFFSGRLPSNQLSLCSVLLSMFTSWSDCSHSIFRFLHTYPGVVLVHFKTSWKVSVVIGIESVLSKGSLIFLTVLLSKSASLYRFTSFTIADKHVKILLLLCCNLSHWLVKLQIERRKIALPWVTSLASTKPQWELPIWPHQPSEFNHVSQRLSFLLARTNLLRHIGMYFCHQPIKFFRDDNNMCKAGHSTLYELRKSEGRQPCTWL